MDLRRRSLTLLLLLPAPALAAAPAAARIGYLGPSAETAPHLLVAFREGLAERGWVEGRNLEIEYRWTNAGPLMRDEAELLASVRELVERKVALIVASIDPAISAARAAGARLPVVMLNASDPVAQGFVASLSRPGGRLTGLARQSAELVGKNLQLLLEAVPRVRRVGLPLSTAAGSGNPVLRENAEQSARTLGIELRVLEVGTPADIEALVVGARGAGLDALCFGDTGGGLFFTLRRRIVELALAARLPTVFSNAEIVEAGGLMAYAPSAVDNYRRAAAFIDKILRGTPPGEIPVEQPTQFELTINRATARALGVALPQSLLLRASRLVE